MFLLIFCEQYYGEAFLSYLQFIFQLPCQRFFQKQKDGTPTVKLIENKIVSHIKHFCRGHLKSLCMFVNLYKVIDVIVSQLFDWSCEFQIIFAAFRVLPTCPWEMAQLHVGTDRLHVHLGLLGIVAFYSTLYILKNSKCVMNYSSTVLCMNICRLDNIGKRKMQGQCFSSTS